MANHMQLSVLIISAIAAFCISRTSADASMETYVSDPSAILSPASATQEPQDTLSPTRMLEPILTNLGFQELSMAVPSLFDSAYMTWSGPLTIFAPSDASIRSCGGYCSVPQLLREQIVPGIFSIDYLRKIGFGTKLETMNPGRCIKITSAFNNNSNIKIIFIGGVEITHPDLFNNGLIVVHRLEGFISPLSPFSCNDEKITSLSLPPQSSVSDRSTTTESLSPPSPAIMRLMLRDAMLRLHNNGFSILSHALRVKYAELLSLQNMTLFALDDASIFSGGHAYLSNFRFHIVPNRLLMNADLVRLPAGTALATMESGQTLVVTAAGGRSQMRINYVRITTPDVMYNLKVVVHGVYLPFPHLHPALTYNGSIRGSVYTSDAIFGDGRIFQAKDDGENSLAPTGSCATSEKERGCAAAPNPESKAPL